MGAAGAPSWRSQRQSGEGEKAQTTHFPEHLSILRQTKKNTQPKRIYSANGNPFMPMIYRFYAPLLFSNLCAILMNDNIQWYTYRMLVFFWNTQQMNYFRD